MVRTLNAFAGKFDSSNINKVYVAKFTTQCPFTKTDRVVHYYCRGINKLPPEPSTAADISCAYASSHRMSNNRARGLPTIVDDTADTSKSNKKRKNNSTDTPRRSQRLKQLVPCITPVQNNDNDEDEEEEEDGTSDNAGSADGRALYWSSTEAAKLFLGSKHATEDVFDCLEGRITLLDKVMNHYAGYREVVVGEGEGLSEFNVFHIRIKSMYLSSSTSNRI